MHSSSADDNGDECTAAAAAAAAAAYPISVLEQCLDNTNTNNISIDWDDRLALQGTWSNAEKGWRVAVEWKFTESCNGGVGLFARQDIAADTVLRVGVLGRNLVQFSNVNDIDAFTQHDDAKLRYVTDYLWGFSHKRTDARGYKLPPTFTTEEEEDRFFGMWIPGNGLNHRETPNTVYRSTERGIDLVALTNIVAGEELYDDYRRHGVAPGWLKEFAETNRVTLNFADCNDFVEPSSY